MFFYVDTFSYGNFNIKRGTRTDLDDVADAVKEGQSVQTIAATYPTAYIKYHNGIEKLHRLAHDKPRERAPDIVVLVGPPGVGKSPYVLQTYPDAYYHTANCKWWQNYTGQEVVVFEEFEGVNHLPFDAFKTMCSPSPWVVECKNGSSQFRSKTVVFISNKHPFLWYSGIGRDALYKRLEGVRTDSRAGFSSKVYLIPDTARDNAGAFAPDHINQALMDRLYLLSPAVLKDYLSLTPSAAEDNVPARFDFNFDHFAARERHGEPRDDFDIMAPPNQQEVMPDPLDEVIGMLTPPASPQAQPPLSPLIIPPPAPRKRPRQPTGQTPVRNQRVSNNRDSPIVVDELDDDLPPIPTLTRQTNFNPPVLVSDSEEENDSLSSD